MKPANSLICVCKPELKRGATCLVIFLLRIPTSGNLSRASGTPQQSGETRNSKRTVGNDTLTFGERKEKSKQFDRENNLLRRNKQRPAERLKARWRRGPRWPKLFALAAVSRTKKKKKGCLFSVSLCLAVASSDSPPLPPAPPAVA